MSPSISVGISSQSHSCQTRLLSFTQNMSGIDSLVILESARAFAAADLAEDNLEVSGAGLLNTESYRERLSEVLKSNPLPDQAVFLLRAIALVGPKIARLLQVVTMISKESQRDDTKRVCAALQAWAKKNLSDHSNVSHTIVPIHSVVQSSAPLNFEIWCRMTASMNNVQFVMTLLGQRW